MQQRPDDAVIETDADGFSPPLYINAVDSERDRTVPACAEAAEGLTSRCRARGPRSTRCRRNSTPIKIPRHGSVHARPALDAHARLPQKESVAGVAQWQSSSFPS
jgi:hypothetical protein